MNDSAASIVMLKSITIDPDFEGVCPPLSADEFVLLEQNILSDGEVTNPLIVWNNSLVDGHHRRQVILKHPDLPFQIKEVSFADKYEAIAWICKNQAGRRNLTHEQLIYLLGKRYEAEKQSWGSSDGFRGNGNDDLVRGQIVPLPDSHKTSRAIAKEYGVEERTVRRAEQFANGVDAAEAACPGVKQELLSGLLKPTKREVSDLAKLPTDEVADKVSEYRKRQAEQEEKRRQAREEKRRRLEEASEAEETDSRYTSISELSANMAKPKPRNNVSNVIGILSDMAQTLQGTCVAYISEFPELLEADNHLLVQALDGLYEYLTGVMKKED